MRKPQHNQANPETPDPGGTWNRGGATAPLAVRCPRCDRGIFVPEGHIVRLPKILPPHCHEIVNPNTGQVVARGALL